MYRVTVLPDNRILACKPGEKLMDVLKGNGIYLDAPCGRSLAPKPPP